MRPDRRRRRALAVLLAALAVGCVAGRCDPTQSHRTTVLVFGDSISSTAIGWPSSVSNPGVDVINLAIPGETSREGLAKLRVLLPALGGPLVHPDLLFVMWGTNDVMLGTAFAYELLAEVQGAAPRVVLGIPPPVFLPIPRLPEVNLALEAIRATLLPMAESLDIPVVDFYGLYEGRAEDFGGDGVHPGPAAQTIMWQQILAAAGMDIAP